MSFIPVTRLNRRNLLSLRRHVMAAGLGLALPVLLGSFALAQTSEVDVTIPNDAIHDRLKGYRCPDPEVAYVQLQNRLNGLKNDIQQYCKSGDPDFSEFQKLVQDFDGLKSTITGATPLVTGQGNQALFNQQSERIRDYSQRLSSSTARLIQLMRGDACFGTGDGKNKRKQVFALVSAVALQISKEVASVAGPYSIPIAAGGVVASGVIAAIPEFFDDRGLDMNQQEQRELFRTSLCRLKQLDEGRVLLDEPEASLEAMLKLQDHLNKKIVDIQNNCPDCRSLIEMFRAGQPVTLARQRDIKTYIHPMGILTAQSLEIEQWLGTTAIPKYEELKENRSGVVLGRSMTNIGYSDIERVLIEKTAPNYFKFLREDFMKRLRAFVNQYESQQESVNGTRSIFGMSRERVKKALKYMDENKDKRNFLAKDGAGKIFRIVVDNALTRRIYCDFFKTAGFRSEEACHPQTTSEFKLFEDMVTDTSTFKSEEERLALAPNPQASGSWIDNLQCLINAWDNDNSKWVKWSEVRTTDSSKVRDGLEKRQIIIRGDGQNGTTGTVSPEFFSEYIKCGASVSGFIGR